MTKANYSAWHIDTEEFSHDWNDLQKLAFFARYAILAPSGHNTQPWRFSPSRQTLILQADYSRRLPHSGVQANEPHVSLGTCLGTLQLAAKGFGYTVAVNYTLSDNDDKIAVIKLSGRTEPDSTLLNAIVHRVSNRNPYAQEPLPAALLADLVRTDLPTVTSHLLSSRDDKSFIAQLTAEATRIIMSDSQFRAELSKWVRNNVTRQHDGMPGFVQGIPTPVSLIAKHVIKNIDISKDQAKKDSSRVLQSANLIIISVKEPTKAALIDGGRLYAQVCILAQQNGIATSGIGAAIIDPTTAVKIASKYNITGKPLAIIRLGKTDKHAKHTPRWPLSNLYSQK